MTAEADTAGARDLCQPQTKNRDGRNTRENAPAVDVQFRRVSEVGERGKRGTDQQREIAHFGTCLPERAQIAV